MFYGLSHSAIRKVLIGFIGGGIVIIFAVLILNSGSTATSDDASAKLLSVASVAGNVHIAVDGRKQRELTEQSILKQNSSIRTGDDGRAVITLGETGVFALGPDTEIVIEETAQPGDTVFSLVSGSVKVRSIASSTAAGEYEITVRAPTVTASVGGAAFGEAVVAFNGAAQETTVYTTVNKVFVRGPKTTEEEASGLSMQAGSKTIVNVQQEASSPEPFADSELPLTGINLAPYVPLDD